MIHIIIIIAAMYGFAYCYRYFRREKSIRQAQEDRHAAEVALATARIKREAERMTQESIKVSTDTEVSQHNDAKPSQEQKEKND